MLDVNNFSQLRIGLATAEQIRMWSNGEVKKPETINYRTLKPEKDGLFCEKIFGPTKDWECYCGKYKRVRFRGIICERCGVEVTRSKVRRERMGHIELAAPSVHIWYLRGTRSWLAYLLSGTEPKEEFKAKQLEKVIYFAANLVVTIDVEQRDEDLQSLEADYLAERDEINKELELELAERHDELEGEVRKLEKGGAKDAEIRNRQKAAEKDLTAIRERYEEEFDLLERVWDEFKSLHARQIIEDEELWRELEDRYGDYFTGGMGAEAIKLLIEEIDLVEEEVKLRAQIDPAEGQKPLSAQRKQKAIKRLKIVAAFNRTAEEGARENDPRAMILDVVPVIPPELRPMVQLDGGRFATSDLNDLYRRVINRNNRLKRLLDLGAPEIIVNNEKRMLQEAVDALFDNGRRGRPVTGPGNRPLKSLSDMLKGKQGRFRQNLLGKRVDYSGRSVIVVGPTLKLHQCGLPKLMALELFKPFVMKALVDRELAQNIKSAKRMVERRRSAVYDVLEDVIREHPVMLNRAPTLHRLGIQAFEPVLVEGKAIQIHPLVCTAFNADFDGDQMAVHLPLSAEAQAEARVLMLSAHNLLSPAHGRPMVTPTKEMLIGAYYLTEPEDGAIGEGRTYRHLEQVERDIEAGLLEAHAAITLRPGPDGSDRLETTAGRVLFNTVLPDDFPYWNKSIRKGEMSDLVDQLVIFYPNATVAHSLDLLKELTLKWSTKSGLTMAISDVKTPESKKSILDRFEDETEKVERNFRRGVITDGERIQKAVEIWSEATTEVTEAVADAMGNEKFNSLNMMVGSGARGNMMQVRQIAGMRGLVANPRGDMIPRPIKSNFREGLDVLEYFIATPGARKGLVDTALRTADSGYLTRRLVDVAQELIINEEDPFATGAPVRGIWINGVHPDGFADADGNYVGTQRTAPSDRAVKSYMDTRLFSRTLADDVTLSDGRLVPKGTEVGLELMVALRDDETITRIRVLSPLTDESNFGITAKGYGTSLATSKTIEPGEAVGVIGAQSIGEPGTQLTMRTFHTGGVASAGGDITGGLPRVVELFEARTPKNKAVLAATSGVVRIGEDDGKGRVVTIVSDDGEEDVYTVAREARLEVKDGDDITAGDAMVEGPRDPKELMDIQGVYSTQRYLVDQVQKVYRDQGVSIHDKHIELIVRQMTRRVAIQEPGDSSFLPGERVDSQTFRDTNARLLQEGQRPADGRPELMGITKASLATDSWLSAASFQETTRVLTEAAIESRYDGLMGLKENIIIGKLIPAGTGMERFAEIDTYAPDYEPMEYFSSDDEGQGGADFLAQQAGVTPALVGAAAAGADGSGVIGAVPDSASGGDVAG